MNLLEKIDKDLEESFKKVVSNGWKLRNVIASGLEEIKELEDEQNRLKNYYESLKVLKETCYSNTTPSSKIHMNKIKNELKTIEEKAVKSENFELAHIAYIYQNLILVQLEGVRPS